MSTLAIEVEPLAVDVSFTDSALRVLLLGNADPNDLAGAN
jgi:hypothetical protein